jgi:hypothetical protein
MVRIRFPPAESRQTIGSSAAEPHLPFVASHCQSCGVSILARSRS